MTTNLFLKPEWTTREEVFANWSIEWRNGLGVSPLPEVEWKAPRVEVDSGVVHFKLENGALWADITQDVSVVAGGVYRLSVEAEPQLRHGGNPATDRLSGEIAAYTGANPVWRGTDFFPNNAWRPFVADVTAATIGQVKIGWSVRLRHALDQNWYHLRNPRLEVVSLPTPAPEGDAPTNPPTPITVDLAMLTTLVGAVESDVNLSNSINTRIQAGLDAIKTEMIRLRGG